MRATAKYLNDPHRSQHIIGKTLSEAISEIPSFVFTHIILKRQAARPSDKFLIEETHSDFIAVKLTLN